MACAAVGVMCGAVCAPLNPGYRFDELRFYLGDLGAKALLLAEDDQGPARTIAGELGIPCLDLAWSADAPAGSYRLLAQAAGGPRQADSPPEAEDTALVLHTSGTTSRPKIVPLSHGNLGSSAHNVAATLRLTTADRCLNMMPLFHIHGLVAALLATLASGGSIACTPGYRDGSFLAWLDAFRPTWTTAVPSMYQAVLAELAGAPAGAAAGRLRLARSSSAALPPAVMRDLEAALGAPVIEAYGMTEAAHQMTSNPLPPGVRKPGSVGLAAGPEVAILDDQSRALGAGAAGEIAIRGSNVTRGYDGNPEANAQAFTHGWFRTGDQGFLDPDGYLFLTGRLKEIINRGGEKVSPREVDDALLEHPAVGQAVAFAVAHPTLGEDVAAAVVLKPGADAEAEAIRASLFGRLADFKIPSQLVVVPTIPKGPTGKVQRIGLAQKLVDRLQPAHVRPRDETEEILARIFGEVLGVEHVGVLDNFFALGGDSLRAFQIMGRIRERLQVDISIVELFRAPTVALLAQVVGRLHEQARIASLERSLAEVERISDDEAMRRLRQT
jgi:acyl-CoA synthetase (AMP-forming)/AMP-acid ligase II